jgi:hypothetical protein
MRATTLTSRASLARRGWPGCAFLLKDAAGPSTRCTPGEVLRSVVLI